MSQPSGITIIRVHAGAPSAQPSDDPVPRRRTPGIVFIHTPDIELAAILPPPAVNTAEHVLDVADDPPYPESRTPGSVMRTILVQPASARGSKIGLTSLHVDRSPEHENADEEDEEKANADDEIARGQFLLNRRPSVSYSGITSTLRRIPSDAHRSFSSLPDGVLALSLEFLSSRELCILASADRRMADITTRNHLWAVRCGFMQRSGLDSSIFMHEPRLKQRYTMYRSYRINQIETEYRTKVKSLQQRRLMCCLHWFDGPSFFAVIGICLVLGLGLTARHIQSTQGTSPLDAVAVWPYFLAIGFGIGITVCICIARLDRGSHRCCHPTVYDQNGEGVVRLFMATALMDHGQQLALSGFMFLLFCLWCVLFLLRVSAWIDWSYPQVFAPLFADFGLLALMCCHPLALRSTLRVRLQNCTMLWCVIIGPMLAFCLLVCLRMESGIVLTKGDGAQLSWMMAIIPLLYLNFLACLASLLLAWDDGSVGPFLAGLCCWGPMLCFEVLLAHWLDNGGFSGSGPRFEHVLVPLWITMALCLLMSVVVCICNQPPTTSLRVWREPHPEREPLLI